MQLIPINPPPARLSPPDKPQQLIRVSYQAASPSTYRPDSPPPPKFSFLVWNKPQMRTAPPAKTKVKYKTLPEFAKRFQVSSYNCVSSGIRKQSAARFTAQRSTYPLSSIRDVRKLQSPNPIKYKEYPLSNRSCLDTRFQPLSAIQAFRCYEKKHSRLSPPE